VNPPTDTKSASAVAAIRKSRGWSQAELAASVGTTRETISKVETGLRPSAELRASLALALDETEERLFGRGPTADELRELERVHNALLERHPQALHEGPLSFELASQGRVCIHAGAGLYFLADEELWRVEDTGEDLAYALIHAGGRAEFVARVPKITAKRPAG
jgi:transcriptional regulator with XRE-family HTH domain